MAKSYEQRLEEQRLRQKALRERKRRERSPHRDDIARMLLHVIVRESVKGGSYEKLDRAMDLVTRELVEQGFDQRKTEQVIEEIIERHEQGWQPRHRTHVLRETWRAEEEAAPEGDDDDRV